MALSRQAVLEAAIELADGAGVESLSMRALGARLGVEAMSLYNHVANKDDVLGGIADLVWSGVDLAASARSWRSGVRRISVSAHEALLAHPWACRVHNVRIGPSRLRYINAVLGHLREGGFAADVAYHAHHTLDGHIFGYTLQVLDYGAGDQGATDATEKLIASLSDELPWFTEHLGQHMAGDVPGRGFEIGLDLILDGLERSL